MFLSTDFIKCGIFSFFHEIIFQQGDYAVNYLKMLLRYDNLRRMLDTTVEFANRMFLAKDFSPKHDYKLLMRTYYLTDLTSIDFRQECC